MFIGILKDTIMITAFVLVVMLIIEYINVRTRGNWSKPLQRSGWLQILSAAFLGIIPGCLGTYTAVSLYTHKIYGFAALVTTMIATSGDEAFLMLAIMPGSALKLFVIIFVISVITGLIIFLIMKNRTLMHIPENHLKIHSEQGDCICFDPKIIVDQIKNISFQRAIILAGLLLFLFGLLIGVIGEDHHFLMPGNGSDPLLPETESHGFEWSWVSATFLFVTIIALFIISTVNDHFLNEHLWGHIIKKHFLKIFLWTFATLLLIHFINDFIDVESWIKNNLFSILIIALLIGIIPQSGPHIVFVLLFVEGTIPFSILLANSIVQDGHGAIPLLAESKKSFIVMKFVNILVGLLVGIAGLTFGF
ncbi:MAG: arsenic efflux protein [Bacteroidetes bacterium]|nr:arsenic efflux protein [Bacteroidota bacterium]